MDSFVKHFTWYLNDVNLWLLSNEYSVVSPAYSMGDSLCKFYLMFTYDRQENTFEVFLCRGSEDRGPTLVEARIILSLRTSSRRFLCSREFEVSLQKRWCKGFILSLTEYDLLDCMESEGDALIVNCESTLLEPTFVHLTEDLKDLSADLLELRRRLRSANACFIAGGESIPVHKEILCSRSPCMKRMMKEGDCWLDERFPAAVVKVMLDYLYSGTFSLKELDSTYVEQLYSCACYYEISDLVKLLTPRKTYASSPANIKTENHTIHFSNFTELCRCRHSVEHRRIKMEFDEDVVMNVKIIFEPYKKLGKIILETSLLNLVNVESLFVRLYLLDHSDTPRSVKDVPLKLRDERELKFFLEYESESLFSGRNSILPNDIFALRYELKFRLTGELHISDPDVLDGSERWPLNYGASVALMKSMEYLLESKYGADAYLVLPSSERQDSSVPPRLSVHKSILSLRSSVFEELFKESHEVFVDLSEPVVNGLLHYIYSGVLLAAQPQALDVLHRAAATYGIKCLKRACEEAIGKITLNTTNVYYVYMTAVRGGLDNLRNFCKSWIVRNQDLILGSYGLDKLREIDKSAWDEITSLVSTRS